ncbi:hypothetical protein SAMN05444274_10626 [Mariniphaga anaerophila]|uniref:Uncharacterized protein n=1 Tax=Mariniphaga anaerophila TaxID=1484053 RepID=A0A1M5CAN5_9BACT|nr:hypothetical protein [Mariniphaga anaerophila]SHF51750.1 hypothetical protein SAMN05444274_10626 [Mariniphaga anaerophila]
MKTILTILAITFLWGCNKSSKTNETTDPDWAQAVTAFKELQETLKKENGETWNHSLEGPLIFVNRDTRAIIANESDNSGELVKRENLFVGKLPENINIANTAFDWNGKKWTMVAFPLPDTKEKRLNLLIHESFHRIQPAIGFGSLAEIQSVHLDSKNGRVWLKLELEALKKALDSNEPEIHIKNALLFRQHRYQSFPDAKQAENSLEINEGLAEYTGSILSKRTDSDLKKHYISQIDWFYTLPAFVRSFPYFTIPVYGYFLQKTDKGWNLKITKDTNLTDFFTGFWNVDCQELTDDTILEIGKTYGIDSIIENETERENKKEELKNRYKKKFLSDSVVVIGLEALNLGFDPSNVMPLDSSGTVYPNLRVTDNWGILEVDSCGALIGPAWNKVIISYPELITDTLIYGKGWKLKLNQSWRLDLVDKKYMVTKE